MADMEKDFLEEEDFGDNAVIVLTDGETGEDMEFDVLARAEIDGKLYYALAPVGDESDEYIILSAQEDGEDIVFESVDDDDEFEKAEDFFNDLFMNADVDYDEK